MKEAELREVFEEERKPVEEFARAEYGVELTVGIAFGMRPQDAGRATRVLVSVYSRKDLSDRVTHHVGNDVDPVTEKQVRDGFKKVTKTWALIFGATERAKAGKP